MEANQVPSWIGASPTEERDIFYALQTLARRLKTVAGPEDADSHLLCPAAEHRARRLPRFRQGRRGRQVDHLHPEAAHVRGIRHRQRDWHRHAVRRHHRHRLSRRAHGRRRVERRGRGDRRHRADRPRDERQLRDRRRAAAGHRTQQAARRDREGEARRPHGAEPEAGGRAGGRQREAAEERERRARPGPARSPSGRRCRPSRDVLLGARRRARQGEDRHRGPGGRAAWRSQQISPGVSKFTTATASSPMPSRRRK